MSVRVALAGVGNCANSLVQGVTFYADAAADTTIPGLMHKGLGPYAVAATQINTKSASSSAP